MIHPLQLRACQHHYQQRAATLEAPRIDLSRHRSRLSLGDWLKEFLAEFSETMQVPLTEIEVDDASDELEVRFDPTHLHQVVWNLCDNAIKYGESLRDGIKAEIRLSRLEPGATGLISKSPTAAPG